MAHHEPGAQLRGYVAALAAHSLKDFCAVEPGVSPGGMAVRLVITREASSAGLGGKMPPSTAGRMPAATWWQCAAASAADDEAAWRLTAVDCPLSLRAVMGTSCEFGKRNLGVGWLAAWECSAE